MTFKLRTGMLFLGLGLILISGCTVRHSTQQGPTANKTTTQSNTDIEAQPGWFACQTHADCKVEPGVCGEFQGVNTGFLDLFRQYRERMDQVVNCTNKNQQKAPSEARCIEHRCSVGTAQ